jgi:hypothetical protein
MFACLTSKSQSKVYPFDMWDNKDVINSNVCAIIDGMTQEEKDVIFYLNMVRLNPSLFAETYLQKYLDEHKMNNSPIARELKGELKRTNPMDMLHWIPQLQEAAVNYADTSGMKGLIGHIDFRKRMRPFIKRYSTTGENCSYGTTGALEIVIDLLLDEGIVDRGHRRNILNSEYKFVGVAIRDHNSRYKRVCVMDFLGSRLQDVK